MRTTRTVGGFITAALAGMALVSPAVGGDGTSNPEKTSRVTLNYSNASVVEVIRALTAQSGVSVALNPTVKGEITVHLKDKTVDDAIRVVANLAGLSARRVSDTYVIAPFAEMRATLERLGVTKQVKLGYLAPGEAASIVAAAFPDLTARASGKGLALTGAQDDIERAERLIRDNDIQSPEAIRATEKVELKHRAPSQAVTILQKMVPGIQAEAAGSGVVLAGTQRQVSDARHSLLLIDVEMLPDTEMRVYKIKYAPATQLVNLLSRVAPDVEVHTGPESNAPQRPSFSPLTGQFVGITGGGSGVGSGGGQQALGDPTAQGAGAPGVGIGSPAGSAQAGVNKLALSLILRGAPAAVAEAVKVLDSVDVAPKQMVVECRVVDTSPEYFRNIGVEWQWNSFQFVERPSVSGGTVPGVPVGTVGLPTGPLGFGSFGRVQFNPLATLNAMVEQKHAKLLANPQVVVINDQDASIFIGDTLRFQSLAQSSPTTGNQFTVVEVPVGIILLVRPRVNDDGHITLRVHPVVSTVTGFVNGLPQTSAREAETTVRVKNNDTLVMGGLIREQDIKQFSKIPLLGDLPLVGQLFKNELRDRRRSEVLIFLTIRLIEE